MPANGGSLWSSHAFDVPIDYLLFKKNVPDTNALELLEFLRGESFVCMSWPLHGYLFHVLSAESLGAWHSEIAGKRHNRDLPAVGNKRLPQK